MGSNGIPAGGNGVAALTLYDRIRVCPGVIYAYEIVAGGIKAVNLCIYGLYCVVIPSLAVLRLMIDGAPYDLYLTG